MLKNIGRLVLCLWLLCFLSCGGEGRLIYFKDNVELSFERALKAWIQNSENLDALEWRKGSGIPLLVTASDELFVDAVEMMLKNGANPNVTSAMLGETPLHAAMKPCDPKREKCELLFKKTRKIATLLLFRKAKVSAVDDKGKTPLHWAALADRPDLCELLLKHGAKADAQDKEGFTPLRRLEDIRDPKAGLFFDKTITVLKKFEPVRSPLEKEAGQGDAAKQNPPANLIK